MPEFNSGKTFEIQCVLRWLCCAMVLVPSGNVLAQQPDSQAKVPDLSLMGGSAGWRPRLS